MKKYIFTLLAMTISTAHADVLPHDKIIGFPDSTKGYFKTFQPKLKVFDGCVPFPAVDAAGNVSGGLDNAGAMNGHCSSSSGQVYVNQATYKGECAVMYSWFFPKDQNVDGPGNKGHRYDWENVVVWLSSCSDNAKINAVSYSGHGKYDKYTDPALDGTHPLVAYQRNPFPLNHSLTRTYEKGGYQSAVSWLGMTEQARQTLDSYNFGHANVPFKTSNFMRNIQLAYYK